MEMSKKETRTAKRPNLPKLSLWRQLLLYLLMLLFIALSLTNVHFGYMPEAVALLCYMLSALSVAIGCYYLIADVSVRMANAAKRKIAAHPHANRVASDARLRTVVFTIPGLAANILFAACNAITGILAHSAWFISLAVYYTLLSMMRYSAVTKVRTLSGNRHETDWRNQGIAVYRKNSAMFLFMALALAAMVLLLEHAEGGKNYPGLTIYAVAAYTTCKIIVSSVNIVKVRKHRSPLLTIIRKIGYTDACMSVLTLQTAMFSSFASEKSEAFVRLMNGVTGSAVCLLIAIFGVQGLYSARNMNAQDPQ